MRSERIENILSYTIVAYIFIFPFVFTWWVDQKLELSKGMQSASDEFIYFGPLIIGFAFSFFTGFYIGKFITWLITRKSDEV